MDALLEIIHSSRPGDVIAFQYSGHGILFPPQPNTSGAQNNALVPIDFDSGAFFLDDDIAGVFAEIPDGVNLTSFLDCCHSGEISRFAFGSTLSYSALAGRAEVADVRSRFMELTKEMEAAHLDYRAALAPAPRIQRPSPQQRREVVFSACLDKEVAFERNGQGEFTMRAVPILREGIAGLTNQAFQEAVSAAFGHPSAQTPTLDCAFPLQTARLLQSV